MCEPWLLTPHIKKKDAPVISKKYIREDGVAVDDLQGSTAAQAREEPKRSVVSFQHNHKTKTQKTRERVLRSVALQQQEEEAHIRRLKALVVLKVL